MRGLAHLGQISHSLRNSYKNIMCSLGEGQPIYNPMQGVWNGLGGLSKAGRGKKHLISTFACFLTAAAKV